MRRPAPPLSLPPALTSRPGASPRASLLKKEIDSRVAASGGRFSVHYVVDKASSPSWTGGVGYVTKQMLADKLPPPSEKTMVYVCGPPPMYKAVCGPKGTPEDPKAQGELGGYLGAMGYPNVFKF